MATEIRWNNIIIIITCIIISSSTTIIITKLSMCWLCLQVATEASHVATMKTIRQVKTVFIIFIAFVCCWIPYVIVLLCDSSDSLPLSVHLYTSMLAHLHASLNFAIYGLSNYSLCGNCRHFADNVSVCCSQRMIPTNVVSAVVCNSPYLRTNRRTGIASEVEMNRTLVTVECYQLQEIER